MPKGVRAASSVPHSLTKSTLSSVWISDALLADTYRRFTCRHRRHGSNVPGPLEARRRATKRRNTNLAHVASSNSPIDPAVWRSSNPQDGWWKSSPSPPENHTPSSLLPSWLFGTSPPPTSSSIFDHLPYDNSRTDPFLTEGTLSQINENQVQLRLQDCENVQDIHRLLRTYNIDLRISLNINAMIFGHIIELTDRGSTVQLASYLTDPVFHPPGTQNHKLFMEHFKESTYNAEINSAIYESLCRATRLGLISPGVLQDIVFILLDQHMIPATANADISLALLKSLDTSGIFRIQDLSLDFIHGLCSRLMENPPCAVTLGLFRYLQTRLPEQNILQESEVMVQWIQKYATNQVLSVSNNFSAAILGLPPSDQRKLILHTTELLVRASQSYSQNDKMLHFWYEVLSNFTSKEVSTMFSRKEDIVNLRCNSLSQSDKEASVIISAWVILTLHHQPDSNTNTPFDLNLGSFGFEEVFEHSNRLDLLSQVMFAVSRYPLPHATRFLDNLQRLPAFKQPQVAIHEALDLQIQAVNNSIFSKLGDDRFYVLAKTRLSDALVEFSESINSDPEVFKHLARALIHKNKSNFKLVLRVLKHNLALKNALSQSGIRRIDSRMKLQKSHSKLNPNAALDLINHLAISFALSQVVSARSALIMVYWCYIFLHRYGAPIQPAITRALWYAGVTRYGPAGCPTAQLKWITRKVREVEGKDVANMLLWSSKFREHHVEVLKGMDWKEKDLPGLKARTETMHSQLRRSAMERDDELLDMLENEGSWAAADRTIPMPWEKVVDQQRSTPNTIMT